MYLFGFCLVQVFVQISAENFFIYLVVAFVFSFDFRLGNINGVGDVDANWTFVGAAKVRWV